MPFQQPFVTYPVLTGTFCGRKTIIFYWPCCQTIAPMTRYLHRAIPTISILKDLKPSFHEVTLFHLSLFALRVVSVQ